MTDTNLWDPVPWMTGGGAQHSTNLGRNVAYAAFGGHEGIVSSKDLEVRELATPGTQVRIFPGLAAIQNRAQGASGEMYVGRLPEPDAGASDPAPERVDIAATDSTGGRSDLIVARVENPYEPGENWTKPTDPKVGPYMFTRVLSGVPAGTTTVKELGLGYSAIALARIDIPASTSVITQSMITDLRKMNGVRNRRFSAVIAGTAANQQTLTETSMTQWPTAIALDVEMPEWATHAAGTVILGGVGYDGAPVADLRLAYGPDYKTQTTRADMSAESGYNRTTIMVGNPAANIASKAGTTFTVTVEAKINSGGTNPYLGWNQSSMARIEVEFIEEPTTNV